MRLVEVDRETTDAFFEAGGVIHVHPQGYGMHAGHTISKAGGFKSVAQGLAEWRESMQGVPLLLIDPEDGHPENPFREGGTCKLHTPTTEGGLAS